MTQGITSLVIEATGVIVALSSKRRIMLRKRVKSDIEIYWNWKTSMTWQEFCKLNTKGRNTQRTKDVVRLTLTDIAKVHFCKVR